MTKADDPFYNRKPVPDEFIKDVGYTGLTPQEEYHNRERKYSAQNGVDVRKFGDSNKSGFKPQDDPYYGRKRVSNAETAGVADTGLTAEEEYSNRERKYSVNGVDVRKFSTSATGGLEPQNDPYYGRKPVSSNLTKGIGETGQTPAEEFEVRERKQSIVNFSSDPFQLLTGQGHRQSISGGHVAGAAADATRRRSSATPATGLHSTAQHHSGYDGDSKLAPIVSRADQPDPSPAAGVGNTEDSISSTSGATSSNGVGYTTNNGHTSNSGQTPVYTQVTSGTTTTSSATTSTPVQHQYDDPDSVAPDERR